MARTDTAAAINATVVPTVVYGVDPRGVGRFRALVGQFAAALNGRTGQHVYRTPDAFHGWGISPQRFAGMAGLGTARPISQRAATLVDQKEASPLNSLAAQLFLERTLRGSR